VTMAQGFPIRACCSFGSGRLPTIAKLGSMRRNHTTH
jgi:hypothetical protein